MKRRILLVCVLVMSMIALLGVSACADSVTTEYPAITLGTETSTVISNGGDYNYFSFIPEATGEYKWYSLASRDTYGYIFDENMNEIARDDDSGEGNNFMIQRTLEAGTKYI